MRILIVTPLVPPEPGGPSYYSVALKDALERAGNTADLIAFREVRKYPSGIRHIIFLYKVLFRALTVDVLMVLDTVSVALPAVLAGWVLGKKVIIRTGGDFVWETYIERTGEKVKLSEFYKKPHTFSKKERMLIFLQKHLVLRLATKVVFSTHWQRDIWRVPYGIPDRKTVVIENAHGGCHPTLQKGRTVVGVREGDEAVKRYGNRHTFLWVGRDLVLKNVDALKKAFEKVKEKYPAMELKLLSGVSHEEVEQEIKNARCLVVSSISEVSPNIVYEAISLATPVICTADTGIYAPAFKGVTFVDTLDEVMFADALVCMCDDVFYLEQTSGMSVTGVTRAYREVAREMSDLCV